MDIADLANSLPYGDTVAKWRASCGRDDDEVRGLAEKRHCKKKPRCEAGLLTTSGGINGPGIGFLPEFPRYLSVTSGRDINWQRFASVIQALRILS
jgi:hypothetical protein